MTKKQQFHSTILSVLIMALLLLISRRLWLRADLTANKAYTLSAVSRNLRNEIDEEVRITYYLSGKLLSLEPVPAEITDILREYEARSRGKIRVTVKDPGMDPQEAERFSLVSQPLQNMEQNQVSFSMVYSGIVIEYLNKFEVLPWVFTLDTLEYDVTSRIRALISGKRRELGVIAAEPQKDWNEYYGYFNQVLVQSGYTVLPLRPGEEIPDTLPVLLVLGGAEELDEYSLYRIDRYIQLGGRVLFAVETVDVDFNTWEGRIKSDKGLLAMISYYGATLGEGLALDVAALPIPFQDPVNRQQRQIPYPPWVGVLEKQGNNNHPISSGFAGVDLFWASPLNFTLPESGTVRGEVLFSSTPQAWLMTRDFSLRPEQSMLFFAEEEETRGEKILAAALEGKFPSWFEDVDKPRREGGEWIDDTVETSREDELPGVPSEPGESRPEDELPGMPSEPRESRLVVIGDADIGGYLIQYTQTQQPINLNFLLQAVDWLGQDDDIIGIRNRTGGSGRLDRISDEAQRMGIMNFSRILNILLLPLAIIIFGVYRILKRKYKTALTGVASKEQDHGV
jgi:ABC-type uncharacterized transport system involved in gliding motility auxiliary subunit